MRKISLDDVGQVMSGDYYINCKDSNLTGEVYTVMVIKTDGQALALSFPVSKLGKRDITSNQRRAIRWFMKRNR